VKHTTRRDGFRRKGQVVRGGDSTDRPVARGCLRTSVRGRSACSNNSTGRYSPSATRASGATADAATARAACSGISLSPHPGTAWTTRERASHGCGLRAAGGIDTNIGLSRTLPFRARARANTRPAITIAVSRASLGDATMNVAVQLARLALMIGRTRNVGAQGKHASMVVSIVSIGLAALVAGACVAQPCRPCPSHRRRKFRPWQTHCRSMSQHQLKTRSLSCCIRLP
jgi:hypothetical protein